MVKRKLKEKFLGTAGIFSGFTSFLGSYQVCHNLCVGLLAMLSILGITVAGMPLLFLTKVAIYFWIAAITLLIIMLVLKVTAMKNLSTKMLILNAGFIALGIPFKQLHLYNLNFIVGSLLIVVALILFIKGKWRLHKHETAS